MARSRKDADTEATVEVPVDLQLHTDEEITAWRADAAKLAQVQAELDATRAAIGDTVIEATAEIARERDILRQRVEKLEAKGPPVELPPPPSTPPPTPKDWIDQQLQRFVGEVRKLGGTVDQGREALYRRAILNIAGASPKPHRSPGPNRRRRG